MFKPNQLVHSLIFSPFSYFSEEPRSEHEKLVSDDSDVINDDFGFSSTKIGYQRLISDSECESDSDSDWLAIGISNFFKLLIMFKLNQ